MSAGNLTKREEKKASALDQVEKEEIGYETNNTAGIVEEIGPAKTKRGIRTMKDLFKALDKDEDGRKEAEKIEEAELGFKPDKREKSAGKVLFDKDAESESDGDDSDLGGEMK